MTDALHVAVGVVQAADGRVLVAHRDAQRHQGGALEFPGGKIEAGESALKALERELEEEVGLRALASEALIRIRHRYPERRVVLEVRRITQWVGEPVAREGGAVAWRWPAELTPEVFPRANRPILAALQWPPISPVTAALDDAGMGALERLVAECRATLASRACLLRLRRGAVGDEGWSRAVTRLAALARSYPASRLVVDARGTPVAELPAEVGLHLPSETLRHRWADPPEDGRLWSCACHGAADLAAAEGLGVDLAYLGPVAPTPTHPQAKGLGWAGFARLAEETTLPLYAIGGLGPGDLAAARAAGAVGVAGIRGFWHGPG